MTNTLSNRGEDNDSTDNIDSDTPRSGVATPQPDPSDKRFPGISHSYFGQVGTSSSSVPSGIVTSVGTKHASSVPLPLDEMVEGFVLLSVAPDAQKENALCPEKTPSEKKSAPAQAYDRSNIQKAKGLPQTSSLHPYPTPPASQSPSLNNLKLSDASADGECAVPKKLVSLLQPHRKSLSILDSLPMRARGESLKSWNPLSSVVTTNNVHAAHFSKPSGHAATTPITPHSCLNSYFQESSDSHDTLQRLTSNAPRKKSTPATPRALSSTTSKSDGSDPANEKTSKTNESIPHRPHLSTAASAASSVVAPTSSFKGKLTVKIVEARGLRRSKDPYVVAVFQRNELVSAGPRPEDGDHNEKPGHIAVGGIPISRSGSDAGRPMAIPMKSRQSSNTSLSDWRDFKAKPRLSMTNPKWDTEAVFDVVGSDSTLNITVYDRGTEKEEFLGHIDLEPRLVENDTTPSKGWFTLHTLIGADTETSSEIYVEITFQKSEKRHYGPADFDVLKLIGKGTFGQVYQVRKKDTKRIYAMKVLQKKVIVQKKEVTHTVGERNILVRTAMTDSPFIVGLKFSFQTPTDLYLVTDYMSGGELFWHLQKEGRFDEKKRAKFYIAELILALQHLHTHDIVYRDLKPENILLDANGHIALCDFGLSKANLTQNATTNTFCGTTEYLAPEVLLDEAGYTKMVDFWSLGVLVFEMCCGWSPFYAEDTQQMYKNIAFGKVRFPRDTLTVEGRSFVKGLLNRNPRHRLGANGDAEELKAHPFFAEIDWVALTKKQTTPPFKPQLKSETDTSNFDPDFTDVPVNGGGSSSLNARAAALASNAAASTPLSPTMQANFKGFTFVDENSLEENMRDRYRESDNELEDNDQHDSDDDEWEDRFDVSEKARGDRMSGIVHTTNDDVGFNGGHFEP
ncbi:BPK2, Sch9-like camp-dependent protein kinase catalytic subunit [Calycina marina]|uniref:non-specific serine/threonine protein kinase n=1 Tax=Calycina marina TaxID=1763456 RepID=A0A9P7YXV8_9HELO|nr:BPK2, Sch9-like camp-dependent protein kinase catalytic subunit [Calycina marina]